MNLEEKKKKLTEEYEVLKQQVQKAEEMKQNFIMAMLKIEGQLILVKELIEAKDTED